MKLDVKGIDRLKVTSLGLDLSRFRSAPSARLSHFPLERDRAFPAQC